MAKKNMDILLGNILGSAAIPPQVKSEEPTSASPAATPAPTQEPKTDAKSCKAPPPTSWRHFSFICSEDLVDKVQAIAHKEGFTIRTFMEYVMKQGIEAYEAKHGKVKKLKIKEIHEVM